MLRFLHYFSIINLFIILLLENDNPGNVPNKGRHFNIQKIGKMYLFVICRQNYFYILPNFGDFGAKLSFFTI